MFLKMITQLIFPLAIYYKYMIQRILAQSLKENTLLTPFGMILEYNLYTLNNLLIIQN